MVGVLPATAEYVFETSLTEDQVAPPSGSTGYGTSTAILNDALNEVAYTVNFAGLDGGALTAIGFYIGSPGTNGTLALALPAEVPLAGRWTITPEVADAILAEELYLAVFTDNAMFPNAELRGNFTSILVENESSTLDAVKSLYR